MSKRGWTKLIIIIVLIVLNVYFMSKRDAETAAENSVSANTSLIGTDIQSSAIQNENNIEDNTEGKTDTSVSNSNIEETNNQADVKEYYFRNDNLLTQHYEKHGIDMGFDSKESYEAAASKVVTNPDALHKTESEDGDDVYYIEATNEFVVVAKDGFIRTYFLPDAGKKYYDKQ